MSGSTSGRSKVIGLAGTVAVALTMISSGGAQATGNSASIRSARATPVQSVCKFKSYSPSTIVLGTRSVRKTFSVKASECHIDSWAVGVYPFQTDPDDAELGIATEARPTISLSPRALRNSDAGKHANAGVDVFGREDPFDRPVIPGGAADLPLTLLRQSTFGSTFRAAPDPVKKGKKITVRATLVRANWNGARTLKNVGFSRARAQLQFRADGASSFRTVKTVTAGSGGKFKTTVKVTRSGRWRLRFTGVSTTAATTSRSDEVKVRR